MKYYHVENVWTRDMECEYRPMMCKLFPSGPIVNSPLLPELKEDCSAMLLCNQMSPCNAF